MSQAKINMSDFDKIKTEIMANTTKLISNEIEIAVKAEMHNIISCSKFKTLVKTLISEILSLNSVLDEIIKSGTSTYLKRIKASLPTNYLDQIITSIQKDVDYRTARSFKRMSEQQEEEFKRTLTKLTRKIEIDNDTIEEKAIEIKTREVDLNKVVAEICKMFISDNDFKDALLDRTAELLANTHKK